MKNLLIDPHMHTLPISLCSRITSEEDIIESLSYGFQGGVLTNHYQSFAFNDETYDEWIEKYICECNKFRELGKKYGFLALCGIEVTMDYDERVHLLIYGADEKFIRENKKLCYMSQKELYEICHRNGCLLIQAHPYRSGTDVQDVNYLDGVEINFHPGHKCCRLNDVVSVAESNRLILTAGCDYHKDSWRPVGGMKIPSGVKNEKDFVEYLRRCENFTIVVDNPENGDKFERTYHIDRL